jgi:hypothetical protein
MGDFSRDTFKLTNVLHQLLTGETVVDPRHYVGIRLQQAVPLVDADWNELEDLRRQEMRIVLRSFLGNGVPNGDDGFRISASGDANNFAIHPGMLLEAGLLAINLSLVTYNSQPESAGQPALTTPAAGSDRIDTIYLDIWDEEVKGLGSASDVDSRIVDSMIGIETSVRIRRRWRVRVAENVADFSSLAPPAGHSFALLAQLRRRGGASTIAESMVIDRRRRGVTLADHLKVPLNVRRGAQVVDCPRFAQMMRSYHASLFARLRQGEVPEPPAADPQRTIYVTALQQLMQFAQSGEVQALAEAVSEENALTVLREFYDRQKAWLDLVTELVGASAASFVTQYGQLLDVGDVTSGAAGLDPALDGEDVFAAVLAQERINFFLSAAAGELPEGDVIALFTNVAPIAPVQAGTVFTFTFNVTASFDGPLDEEEFAVTASLPSDFGAISVTPPVLTLAKPQESATVTVTVDPNGAALTGTLELGVRSVRNPTIESPQLLLSLVRAATPPLPSFFVYSGPTFNVDGRLPIPQNHLTRSQGRRINFLLKNDGTGLRTYEVTGQIVPDVGNTTGWSPIAPFTMPLFQNLAPGESRDVEFRVDGPKSPNPPPPVGTTGTVVVSAVLLQIDGVPVSPPEAPVTVTVPFVVNPATI